MQIIESGDYSLVSNSTIEIYCNLYENDFNPSHPFDNIYSNKDNNCYNNKYKFSNYLIKNRIYILVVSTYSSNTIGPYSIYVFGTDNVILTPISKSMLCIHYKLIVIQIIKRNLQYYTLFFYGYIESNKNLHSNFSFFNKLTNFLFFFFY